MHVTVLYFAALRERLGIAREECALPADVVTVAALKDWMAARGNPWAQAFVEIPRVRVAVDQAMARPDTPLREGAEVAFFPPVTGG
jgi:molybdopterin synthase sulfur carrier subunit